MSVPCRAVEFHQIRGRSAGVTCLRGFTAISSTPGRALAYLLVGRPRRIAPAGGRRYPCPCRLAPTNSRSSASRCEAARGANFVVAAREEGKTRPELAEALAWSLTRILALFPTAWTLTDSHAPACTSPHGRRGAPPQVRTKTKSGCSHTGSLGTLTRRMRLASTCGRAAPRVLHQGAARARSSLHAYPCDALHGRAVAACSHVLSGAVRWRGHGLALGRESAAHPHPRCDGGERVAQLWARIARTGLLPLGSALRADARAIFGAVTRLARRTAKRDGRLGRGLLAHPDVSSARFAHGSDLARWCLPPIAARR